MIVLLKTKHFLLSTLLQCLTESCCLDPLCLLIFWRSGIPGWTTYPMKQHCITSCSVFAMWHWRGCLDTVLVFSSWLCENQAADTRGGNCGFLYPEHLVYFLSCYSWWPYPIHSQNVLFLQYRQRCTLQTSRCICSIFWTEFWKRTSCEGCLVAE